MPNRMRIYFYLIVKEERKGGTASKVEDVYFLHQTTPKPFEGCCVKKEEK
jgi:hypothetical protein